MLEYLTSNVVSGNGAGRIVQIDDRIGDGEDGGNVALEFGQSRSPGGGEAIAGWLKQVFAVARQDEQQAFVARQRQRLTDAGEFRQAEKPF